MCPLAFSPEAIERMTDVYKRAVQELDLSRAPAHERDRLAVYILSTENSTTRTGCCCATTLPPPIPHDFHF